MTTTAAALPDWLQALDSSSTRLAERSRAHEPGDLTTPSFALGWSVADVLSHLGSAAEICTVLLDRGKNGDTTPPTAELVRPIWDRWNELDPASQRSAWLDADARHRELLRALDPMTRVPYFSGLLELDQYAGYRLSEQSVHGWDVEVALDPDATIPPHELTLLWQRLDLVARRFHDNTTRARLAPTRVAIELNDPAQHWWLEIDDEVRLHPGSTPAPATMLRGPAQAALLTVYGRGRPSDEIVVEGAATHDDLVALFPGY